MVIGISFWCLAGTFNFNLNSAIRESRLLPINPVNLNEIVLINSLNCKMTVLFEIRVYSVYSIEEEFGEYNSLNTKRFVMCKRRLNIKIKSDVLVLGCKV